ncbi:uncharacterized protein LOC143235156 isoform X2 [Tachypleus tridentatus]|uniref:uncharacterized protein LOC143235156 isoform X2 n=1 Tax=Tachypleus tridentatus TaxID=6853 RepID=UPI003FD4E36B
MEQKTGLRGLQAWCRMLTQGYKDVDIKDLSSSFRDGLAFCALIHRFRPNLIDYESLSKENILYNNTLAFEVAEKQLGIPALLDAEDMVMYKQPDKLSIATYLSQFYQYFERGQHDVKSEKPVVKRPLSERNTEISLFGPPAKLAAGVITRKSEVCRVCQQKVFILERLIVDGKLYHRTCFKCAKCRALLKPGAYIGDCMGMYECVVCPKVEISRQTYSEKKAYRKQVSLSPAEKRIPIKSEPEKLKISATSATARRQFFTSRLKDIEEKDNQESSTGTGSMVKNSCMSKLLFEEGKELPSYHKKNTVHSILPTAANNGATIRTPRDNEADLSPAANRISTGAVSPDRTTGKVQRKDISYVCRENEIGNVETCNASISPNISSSKQMEIFNIDPIISYSASKLAECKNDKDFQSQEMDIVASARTRRNEATSKIKDIQNEIYVKKAKEDTCKKGVGGECLKESLQMASVPEVQTKKNKDISGAASYETPIPKKWSFSSLDTELPDISTSTHKLSKKSVSSSTGPSCPSTFASQLRFKLKPVPRNESYCINRSGIIGTLDLKDSDKLNVVKKSVSSQFDSHGQYASVTGNIDTHNTTWKQHTKELTVSELHVPFTELRKPEMKSTSRVAEAIKQISSRGGTGTSYNTGAEKHQNFRKMDAATSPFSKEDTVKTQTSGQEHMKILPLSKGKTQTSSRECTGTSSHSKVDIKKTQTCSEYIEKIPFNKVDIARKQISSGIVTQIAPSNKYWMPEKQTVDCLYETKQLYTYKLKTAKGKKSDGFMEDVVKENVGNISEHDCKVQWSSRSNDNVTEDSSTDIEICPNISVIYSSHMKFPEKRVKNSSKFLSGFPNPENCHENLNQFGHDESTDCKDYQGSLNTFNYLKEKNSSSLKNIPTTKKKAHPVDCDSSFIPLENESEEIEGTGSIVVWKNEEKQDSSTEIEKKFTDTGPPKVITVVQKKKNVPNLLTLTTSVETKGYATVLSTSFSETLKHSPVISGTRELCELEQSTSSPKVSVNKYANQSPVINHIKQSSPFLKSNHINSKIEISSPSLKKQADSSSSSPQASVMLEGDNQSIVKDCSGPNMYQKDENTRETETSTESNTFGYWKKKKHPAPPVPIPQRREVQKIPMEEIQTEMKAIDLQQDKLEKIGREIEMKIRNHKSEPESAIEELILELFELVNLKNALFRRQAELVYLMRSQKLEEEQVELEFQIRCHMNKSSSPVAQQYVCGLTLLETKF